MNQLFQDQHPRLLLTCLCALVLTLVLTLGFAQNESDTTETSSEETKVETSVDTESTETSSEAKGTETTETSVETDTNASDEMTETVEDTGDEVTTEEKTEETESSTATESTEDTTTQEDTSDASNTDNSGNQAQDNNASERVITIEYSGGNRKAVDFRYGPWIYSHPNEEGIIGAVGSQGNSQLTVYAKEAELKAPEDVLIATAGERVATFTDGVRVERKRLTALGESLEYSEETGFGELLAQEQIDITVLPKEADGDTTEIQATSATFDVDTDVSVSRGGVTLKSGSQSGEAEEVTFEQGLDLAVMSNPDGQVTLKRSSGDSELTITADSVRVLTESKKLMATGNVKLVDGAITTTGEIVFFDDEIERAEVFGTPDNLAISIDSEFDITIKGQRLEQLIDLDLVEILDETAPSVWDEADFLLTSEMSN